MNKPTQFTPGPWSLCNWMVGNNTPTGEVTICGPEGDEHICTMDGNENNQANRNLIAAAPTMYADLCAVRDYLFELYDEGNAKAGEYAASLGITIEQAEGQHHE